MPSSRPRRRAVGPAGAHVPQDEPRAEPLAPDRPDLADQDPADDERLRRERPPHHDRDGQ